MIPIQFQYRDLINHTLSGFLYMMILGLFIADFCPTQSLIFLKFLNSHLTGFSGVLLIPIVVGFVLSYVAGTMLAQTHSNIRRIAFNIPYNENNIIDKVLNKIMTLFYRTLIIKSVTDNRIVPLKDNSGDNSYTHLLRQKINETWKIHSETITDDKDLTTLFELCRSYVESQPTTLSNIDIERHFVLMLFNARLTFVFLICTIFCFFESINSYYIFIQTYTSISCWIWIITGIYFWFQARSAALRTISNSSHWTRIIYYAFINYRTNEANKKS